MAVTQLCTQTQLERRFSVAGVQAFSDHEQTGVADDDVLDDCINRASIKVIQLCWPYSEAGLATSEQANIWAIDLALFELCQLRGNDPPASVAFAYERTMADLERIRTREVKMYGIPEKGNNLPAVSNLVPDRRDPSAPIRVDQFTSPAAPGVLTQKQLGGWHG